MKYLSLSFFAAILLTNFVECAYANPQNVCPSTEEIVANAKFIKVDKMWNNVWLLYTDNFIANNKTWKIELLMGSLEDTPTKVINHAQTNFKNIPLSSPSVSNESDQVVCVYNDGKYKHGDNDFSLELSAVTIL